MKEHNDTLRALQRLRINPKHSFGQNFLVDEDVYEHILDAARISPDDNILEIGTGIGTLTKRLARHASHVVTIEQDETLLRKLPQEFAHEKNITLIPGSYLDIPHAEVVKLFPGKRTKFIVVANLPYNITAKSLQRLVSDKPVPEKSILMVQREVADRVTAGPGAFSLLALSVQWFAEAKKIFDVYPESFFPQPKVNSAVIELLPRTKPLYELPKGISIEHIFSLAKIAFHQKRKTIINSLSGGLGVEQGEISEIVQELGLDKRVRPQELSHKDWILLAEKLR